MRCNERLIAALLERALALGFDAVVTGHYAKVIEMTKGTRAPCRRRRQRPVRAGRVDCRTAQALDVPTGRHPVEGNGACRSRRTWPVVCSKPDSHDICFIPDGDTRGWLEEKIDMTQGAILTPRVNRSGPIRVPKPSRSVSAAAGHRETCRGRSGTFRTGNPAQGKYRRH